MNEPAVLLLDEPLGALDLKLRKQMQLELMRIQREVGVTFIYVTHDQEEALVMSDRIAVMSDGHVEQIGFPEDIYERPATRFVAGFIGTSNIIEGRCSRPCRRPARARPVRGDRLLVTRRADAPCARRSHRVHRSARKAPSGRRSTSPSADMCTAAGTVVDVVYQGMSTQLVVNTDDGATLVAFRQNNERVSDAGEPGNRVPPHVGARNTTWSWPKRQPSGGRVVSKPDERKDPDRVSWPLSPT